MREGGWFFLRRGSVPAVGAYPFPPERGRLRMVGGYFQTEDSLPWQSRGTTHFALFLLFLRGVDIRPYLRRVRQDGVNEVRVFSQIPAGYDRDGFSAADFRGPWLWAQYYTELVAFFLVCASEGVRVEFTVLTYPWEMAGMRTHLQACYDAAALVWNVTIEDANEPQAQGIDAVAAGEGIDRHGVLHAKGYYLLQRGPGWVDDDPDTHILTMPMGDYVTSHSERSTLEGGFKWVRTPKENRNLRDGWDERKNDTLALEQRNCWAGTKREVKENEPIGIWSIEVPGRRTANPRFAAQNCAAAILNGAGYTMHPQDYLYGRFPDAGSSLVISAVTNVWRALPAGISRGQYVRSGHNELPIEWQDGDSIRDYGIISGTRAYVSPMVPRAGRVIVAKPGWRRIASPSEDVIVLDAA